MRSKFDTTFIYSLQSGPKDMIKIQFNSAVKKIDEFLFSKSFHLRQADRSYAAEAFFWGEGGAWYEKGVIAQDFQEKRNPLQADKIVSTYVF